MCEHKVSRTAIGTAYLRAAHQLFETPPRILMDEPTFFSWLGVTMYLKEDNIDAVLPCVATFLAGSEIVLTFAPPAGGSPSPLALHTASLGEPWVSYFEPDALEAKLIGAGFSKVTFLSPAKAEEQYFRHRSGDLPVPKRTTILLQYCNLLSPFFRHPVKISA